MPEPQHAVKFVDGSDNIVEGLAVPYGGPFGGKDLHGESFGPDTDLALPWFPNEGRPALFHHGLDPELKTSVVGRQTEREERPEGQWVRVQLDRRNRYFDQIKQMVDEGALSFSSGSLGHLVKTAEDGRISAWPWVEISLTPTPANPDAAVYAVKASDAIEHIAAVKSIVPAPLKAAVDVMEDGFTEQPTSDPEPESLADHSQRVLAEVKAWVERVSERSDFRAKAGRELSRANVEALRTAYRLIGELLERNDKPEADEAEAAKAYAEFLRIEAEQLGI